MNQTLENSLRIARLLYQKGDFLEALAAFENAGSEALLAKNFTTYLDCIRVQMQCLGELERAPECAAFLKKLDLFLTDDADIQLKARASWLRTFHYVQIGDAVSQTFLSQTIAIATQAQDLEYLARALTLEVHLSVNATKDWTSALRSLDILDTILESIQLPDVEVWALVARAHVATQRASYELASTLVWKAYYLAQKQGNHLTMPGLLLQLGTIHADFGQKTQAQIYFDLCMAGLDPIKHPRQYRNYSQVAGRSQSTNPLQFDFVVNVESRRLQEKSRGPIDFKNQHLLLDLALLFLKNPGTRYSKEDVLENIWKQAYDPSLHDNLIYVSIKRLRTLIEPDIENPRYILRDRRGYYLNSTCSISFEDQQETTI